MEDFDEAKRLKETIDKLKNERLNVCGPEVRIAVGIGQINVTMSRPAMQHEGRFAVGVATDLPIEAMTVADIEHAACVRLDLRIEPWHRQTLCRSARAWR